MDIKIDRRGSTTTVLLSGRIDKLGSESLQQNLDQVVSGKPEDVILDFKGVNFIGSSGIGKLLMFGKALISQGGRANMVNLSPEIKELFASAKLDKLFNI